MNRVAELSARSFFLLLILFYATGALASLLRLRYGDTGPLTMDYQRVALPTLIALAMVAMAWARLKFISGVTLLLLGLFVYALVVGVWTHGFSRYLLSHVFQALLGIVLFAFGRALLETNTGKFYLALRRLCFWSTIVYVPVMAVFAFWAVSGQVYFGMSASILILAAMFFLTERRYGWAILATLLVLVSGKRGELLGLATAVGVHFYLRGRLMGFGRSARQAAGGAVLIGVGLLALLAFQGGEVLTTLGSKFATIFSADLTDLSSPALRAAIGGRGLELFVLQQEFLQRGDWRVMFGLGYGWNVTMYIAGFSQEVLHFVHLSPLNAVAQYGLLAAILYWGILIAVPLRSMRELRDHPEYMILTPYVAGILVVSLTAYVIAVDPVFWLCLGAISVRSVAARRAQAAGEAGARTPLPTLTAAP